MTSPPPRSATRRPPPRVPSKLPSAKSPVRTFGPYVLAGVVAVCAVLLVRTPAYSPAGAMLGAVLLVGALAWVAAGEAITVPSGDRLRTALPVVSVLVALAAIVPFALTVYPPPVRATVALGAVGESRTMNVDGAVFATFAVVRGGIVPRSSGSAEFFVDVSRGGENPQRIDGAMQPHPGGPLPVHIDLALRGPGTYTARLVNASPALALPITVSLGARYWSSAILALAYGSLALLALVLDSMLYARGAEPAFAASLLVPLLGAFYFQARYRGTDLPSTLLATLAVALLGGGLGGEALGRLARLFVTKKD